jgi:hypothetical protein
VEEEEEESKLRWSYPIRRRRRPASIENADGPDQHENWAQRE